MMLCSSLTFGTRQSLWPAYPTPPFSAFINPTLSQIDIHVRQAGTPAVSGHDHQYRVRKSWMSPIPSSNIVRLGLVCPNTSHSSIVLLSMMVGPVPV